MCDLSGKFEPDLRLPYLNLVPQFGGVEGPENVSAEPSTIGTVEVFKPPAVSLSICLCDV